MKNKGFTLVEVMAIVIIIAAIALVSFPVLTNVVKNNEKIEEDTFKESAVSAGKTYFNLNKDKFVFDGFGYANVEVSELINQNVLDKPNFEYNYDGHLVKCRKNFKCTYFDNYKEYTVGDVVKIKGENYHVISGSNDNQEYVTVLKDNALTSTELLEKGNISASNFAGQVPFTRSGYGWGYDTSLVGAAIKNWTNNSFEDYEVVGNQGYNARLISADDLEQLGYEVEKSGECYNYKLTDKVPEWVRSDSYCYWTMTRLTYPCTTQGLALCINSDGQVTSGDINYSAGLVRPIINIHKFAVDE